MLVGKHLVLQFNYVSKVYIYICIALYILFPLCLIQKSLSTITTTCKRNTMFPTFPNHKWMHCSWEPWLFQCSFWKKHNYTAVKITTKLELEHVVETSTIDSTHTITIWLVVEPPLRSIWVSQLGWLFPIYGNKHDVPNHHLAIIRTRKCMNM